MSFFTFLKPFHVSLSSRVFSFTQVKINGVWGTVCDDGFQDSQNAIVGCRSLGLSGGEAKRKAFFGEGTGLPIHMDDVNCLGNEHNLGDCLFVSDSLTNSGTVNCRHDEDVGLICGPPASTVARPSQQIPTAGPTPTTTQTTMTKKMTTINADTDAASTLSFAITTNTTTSTTTDSSSATRTVLLASLGGVAALGLVLCGACLGAMAIRRSHHRAADIPAVKTVSVVKIPSAYGTQFQIVEEHEMSSGHDFPSDHATSSEAYSTSQGEPSSVYVVEHR